MSPHDHPVRKKIAFLAHGLYFGGATASLYLMMKSLERSPFDKILYVTSCRSEEMKQDFLRYCQSVTTVRIAQVHNNQAGYTPEWQFRLKILYPLGHFVDELIRQHVDILHINSTVFPHIHQAIRSRTQIKIVTHVRELIPSYGNGFGRDYTIREILKRSDAIVTISDNEARLFSGHPNLHVLPNPFDFSVTEGVETTFRKENAISNDCVLVGMSGQFSRTKGHLDFLRALRILDERRLAKFPFRFCILGVSPRPPAWKRAIKSVLRRPDFHRDVLRFIHANDLMPRLLMRPYEYRFFPALKAMDIMVRPSLSGDPWGRDIIEAMAFGKSIVATGNSAFFVRPHETGILVPAGSPEALADGIQELMNDPAKRERFGMEGRRHIERLCDIRRYGDQLTKLYNSL